MSEYDRLKELEAQKLKEAKEARRLVNFHLIECCKNLELCAKALKEFAEALEVQNGR